MTVGLVADIGSTSTRFALARPGPHGVPVLSDTAVFACRDFPNLEAAIDKFLSTLAADARPRAGTLAVAGPVTGDEITLTNSHWRFSITGLQKRLGFDRLSVINDFTAISLSLLKLAADGTASVGPTADLGDAKRLGVIGPGTGLGVGVWSGMKARPYPSPPKADT